MSSTSKARQRIQSLLDANSFVEIGALVKARATDFNMAAARESSDGVITGYGLIDGRLVYVYSQDAGILGGSRRIIGIPCISTACLSSPGTACTAPPAGTQRCHDEGT